MATNPTVKPLGTTSTQVPKAPITTTKPVAASAMPGPAKLSISAGVSQANSKDIASRHPRIQFGSTRDLGQQYFRSMIYGPTSSRKTVTAALFGSQEDVRIILTRRKEQLRGLEKNFNYKYAAVDNASDLEALITHPESFWTDPAWVKNPNRTLVIDDITEGIALLVDDNAVIDDKEVRDRRRSYAESGKDLRNWIQLSFRAPQHIIVVALERIKEIPGGERVLPDLPPSMQSMWTTELDYVFYIKTGTWRFVVDRKTEQFKKIVEGKEDTLTRYIFAKNKQRFTPGKMTGNGIFGVDEPMDLAAIWRKITDANGAQAKVVGK